MPATLIFEYQPGSIKPLIHPEAEQLYGSKDRFPIQETLITQIEKVYGIEEVK